MNHAQKYLAQANRHIAELTVQIARQRVVVKHALDTDQPATLVNSGDPRIHPYIRRFRVLLKSRNQLARVARRFTEALFAGHHATPTCRSTLAWGESL